MFDSIDRMTWGLVVSQRGEHHDHQASDLERSDRERSGRAERLWWMREARFGLFVHWGLYSVAARHEWVKQRERLDDAAYQRYFEHFDPDLYDPRRGPSWPGGRA